MSARPDLIKTLERENRPAAPDKTLVGEESPAPRTPDEKRPELRNDPPHKVPPGTRAAVVEADRERLAAENSRLRATPSSTTPNTQEIDECGAELTWKAGAKLTCGRLAGHTDEHLTVLDGTPLTFPNRAAPSNTQERKSGEPDIHLMLQDFEHYVQTKNPHKRNELYAQIADSFSELSSLRADAKRLDWIEGQCCEEGVQGILQLPCVDLYWGTNWKNQPERSFREAIDAAMGDSASE